MNELILSLAEEEDHHHHPRHPLTQTPSHTDVHT